MVIEHSLYSFSPIQPAMVVDTSPDFEEYLLTCYLEEKSEKTIDSYARRVGRFLRFIKPSNEKDVTKNTIVKFLLLLKSNELQSSSVNADYRAIRTYFNWLLERKRIKESPFSELKPPKVPEGLPKGFSCEEINRMLLETSRDRFLDKRNRAIILVLLDTGLRVSELVNIRKSDVDFKTKSIWVIGKGKKERYVYIGKNSQKALLLYNYYRKNDDYDCLWVSEERRPMTLDGMKVTISKLCKRAGVKGSAHIFRNTAALMCLRNGMGEFLLQMMLGHTTLAMTRRYVKKLGTEDLMLAHQKTSPVDRLGRI